MPMTLSDYLAVPDAQIDLGAAALCIALDEYPQLDVAQYLARLEVHSETVRQLSSNDAQDARLAALAQHLFHDEGFSGNSADYYDPCNSYLNDVLERRTGIPISLSIVYMEVGRRLGLSIEPISFPTHFLLRVTIERMDIVVDPFNKAAVLDRGTLIQHLVPVFGGPQQAEEQLPAALASVPRREVIARMLRNLKSIYLSAKDWVRALRVVDRLVQVHPQLAEEIRDRGQLYALLECPQAAVDDFERYLALRPDARDVAQIETRMAALRGRAARLN
jgi:regulator of sirC expression with transglutaminase-like and TPR domain